MWRTMPRSWEMNNSPASRSRGQAHQQVRHLRLGRGVERRHRLVGDDDARVGGEGAGDGDALALPARELERVAAGDRPAEAHLLEHLRHALVIGRRVLADTVEPVGDLSPDPAARVERRVRVLEDHLHPSQLGRARRRSRAAARRNRGTSRRRPTAAPARWRRGRGSTCRTPTRRRGRPPHRGRPPGRRRPPRGRVGDAAAGS